MTVRRPTTPSVSRVEIAWTAGRQGREQVYRLEAEVLGAALAPWIAKYERFWSAALLRLRDLAEKYHKSRGKRRRSMPK